MREPVRYRSHSATGLTRRSSDGTAGIVGGENAVANVSREKAASTGHVDSILAPTSSSDSRAE